MPRTPVAIDDIDFISYIDNPPTSVGCGTFPKPSRVLATYVNLRRYQKHPRGLKKERTQRTAYKNGNHVSTAKILAKRI